MYLWTKKSTNGTKYLYLAESYKKSNGKNGRKVLEAFGALDSIPPEKLAELKSLYSDKEEKRRQTFQRKLGTLQSLASSPDPAVLLAQTKGMKAPLLHFGHLLLKPLWKELGLPYKLEYLQKADDKVHSWSLEKAAFYLCASKLIDPHSYLGTYQNQSAFLDNPVQGIALDNFYEVLDFLARNKDDILRFVGRKRITPLKEGEVRLLMYDCTNFYFETPFDDLQLFRKQYIDKKRKELVKEGLCPESVQAEIESPEFQDELAKACEEKLPEALRMRGASKEGRFGQPIVSLALVIDDEGVPLDFEVYKGNSSEFKTMENSIEQLCKKYHIKHSFVVADKGLNSGGNLHMLLENKLGFVVSQRVSNLQGPLAKEMLDPAGYKEAVLPSPTKEGCSDKVMYKSVPMIKKGYRTDAKTGKKKEVAVEATVVFTFSEKRKRRDLALLNIDKEKALKAVGEAKLMTNPCTSGWRGLVKTIKETQNGRKDKSLYKAKEINLKVIEDRKRRAGYAALVYASPKGKGAVPIPEEQVLSTYHHLLRVEECFRCMKFNFNIRPMYVRLTDRITGHCLLCILALRLLRMLEEKLKSQGHCMSVNSITAALAEAVLLGVPTGEKDMVFINSKFYTDIYTHSLAKPGRTKGDLDELADLKAIEEKYLEKTEKDGDDIDKVIRAVGLEPLSLLNTTEMVRSTLKIKTAASKLLDPIVGAMVSRLPSVKIQI